MLALDRAFWVGLAKVWPDWRDTLAIVRPATVIRWHRRGFRLFWRWRSRLSGRPSIKTDLRMLIRRMATENPGWGAPRIHGELLKLGIAVAQSTVAGMSSLRHLRGARSHLSSANGNTKR